LQITESTFTGGLSSNVKEDRPTRLVVCIIEEVTLLEGTLGMRFVAITVWVMVDLTGVVRHCRGILKIDDELFGQMYSAGKATIAL